MCVHRGAHEMRRTKVKSVGFKALVRTCVVVVVVVVVVVGVVLGYINSGVRAPS